MANLFKTRRQAKNAISDANPKYSRDDVNKEYNDLYKDNQYFDVGNGIQSSDLSNRDRRRTTNTLIYGDSKNLDARAALNDALYSRGTYLNAIQRLNNVNRRTARQIWRQERRNARDMGYSGDEIKSMAYQNILNREIPDSIDSSTNLARQAGADLGILRESDNPHFALDLDNFRDLSSEEYQTYLQREQDGYDKHRERWKWNSSPLRFVGPSYSLSSDYIKELSTVPEESVEESLPEGAPKPEILNKTVTNTVSNSVVTKPPVADRIVDGHDYTSAGNFSAAFKAAKAANLKNFVWKGKSYGTGMASTPEQITAWMRSQGKSDEEINAYLTKKGMKPVGGTTSGEGSTTTTQNKNFTRNPYGDEALQKAVSTTNLNIPDISRPNQYGLDVPKVGSYAPAYSTYERPGYYDSKADVSRQPRLIDEIIAENDYERAYADYRRQQNGGGRK